MIEPLDGAGVPELPGHGSAVGSYQVDLRVERTVPPAADGGRRWPGKISGREGQCLPDGGFQRTTAPRRPSANDQGRRRFGPATLAQVVGRSSDRQVEAQAAVGDAVERRPGCPERQRLVNGEYVFVLDQPVQYGGKRP